MHPQLIAFELAGRSVVIGSYGVLLGLALALAALALLRAARAAGVELGAAISAAGTAVGAALGGAVSLHGLLVLVERGALEAGLSMFGALLGGAAGLWGALRALAPGVDALALASRVVPAVALAQAVARVGCWLGGCCFGRAWHADFAATLAGRELQLIVEHHPLPLYEAALLLALAAWLAGRRAHRVLAVQYVALYAALRLALAPLRDTVAADPHHPHALGASQTAALVVLLAAMVALTGLALRARFWHRADAR